MALGAQDRTRTYTAIRPLHPECSASTNSATWAILSFQATSPLASPALSSFTRAQDKNRTCTPVTGTWPSTMRVYQFRHLGSEAAAKIIFILI